MIELVDVAPFIGIVPAAFSVLYALSTAIIGVPRSWALLTASIPRERDGLHVIERDRSDLKDYQEANRALEAENKRLRDERDTDDPRDFADEESQRFRNDHKRKWGRVPLTKNWRVI